MATLQLKLLVTIGKPKMQHLRNELMRFVPSRQPLCFRQFDGYKLKAPMLAVLNILPGNALFCSLFHSLEWLSCPTGRPRTFTTARYIPAVNGKQIEARGKYLEAIKIVVQQQDRQHKWFTGGSSGWELTAGTNPFS